MRLSGKVAIVTGAGRGIGRATAAAMLREGAAVVFCDRDIDLARQTVADIGSPAASIAEADISEPADVEAMVTSVVSRLGHIDILVNNAGIGSTALFLDTKLEDWERTLRINLTGTFICAQITARQMVGQGGGRIINIASLSGQKGGVGRAAYGASKAGVELLTKVMAVELAQHGITVNAIAPGPIMTDVARKMHTMETREAYHRLIPQRRYGEPEEIAGAAVFLASDEASYVNGHTLNVDGGFLTAGLQFPYDPATSRTFSTLAGEG